MTATFDFDQLLASVLRDGGPQAADATVVEAALAEVHDTPQRRPLVKALDRRAWPAPRLSLANPDGARLGMVGLVALLTLALVAALVLVGSLLTPPPPPLPGAWIQTGPPGTERESRVGSVGMALLPDGRVLLVGGVGPDPASAETYDPARNTFGPAADQLADTPRDATVVGLRDGVLVFGKGSSSIFDPASGTFAAATPMIADRVLHTTTVLRDGRVLVTGGTGPGGGLMLSSAEVFDPATGSWSKVGSLDVPRQQHAATLLADGRVLITGGTTDDDIGWPLKTAELFDPASGTFTPAGTMVGARVAHTATLLADGRVLVAGGIPDDHPAASLADTELYDPITGLFAPTAPLVTGRYEHAAVVLADGRVLIAGGSNDHGSPLTAEIYDPVAGTFTVAASAAEPHVGPIVRLADGRVLIAGGRPEIFDPAGTTPVVIPRPRADRTFTEAATPDRIRADHTAIRLRDGRVLILGGHGDEEGETNTTAELYDPETGTFSPTGSMSASRGQNSAPPERSRAFLLEDGRVVVTGGTRYEWDVEIYDPTTGRFTRAGSIAREGGIIKHPVTAVQVADGRIFVFGPPATADGDASKWGSTGIYQLDPLAGGATLTKEIDGCDAVSHAVPVDDGRVLVICNGPRSWLELVDVGTGDTSVLDAVLGESAGPLLMLDDGRVAFSAGIGAVNLSVADPGSGQVVKTSVPISPAGIPELALLADGRVLVTGGPDATLWDPATDAWTALPAPIAERFGHTATLLEDGRVLLVGGTTTPPDAGTPRPAGAELFDPAATP